jgi:di/tricarboxylate transporter
MKAQIMGVPAIALIPPVAAGLVQVCFPNMGLAPALCVFTVALLAVGILPEYLTALIFFTLAMLLHIAEPQIVFAGFASSAFWLVFAGFFLGQAVTRTGLGERIGGTVARIVPDGFWWALTGTAAFSVAMSFLMPSAMGRVLLMLPILEALALKLGYYEGGRGKTAIVMTGMICTYIPAIAILPANIPNMVLAGSAEALRLPMPDYGHYLLLHFPVLGLLKTVIITLVAGLVLKPGAEEIAAAKARRGAAKPDKSGATAWTVPEIKLAVILGACLVLWCTDSVHGISPAWVGMVGAIACLMPVTGMLDAQKAVREINIGTLIYIAAIISIGAVVSISGLGSAAAEALLKILPLHTGTTFANYTVLSFLSTILGPLTTTPGVPAVLTPLTLHLAQASGLSACAVMMTQVVGFSTILFPFQTGPLLVGFTMMKFPLWKATKIVLIIAGLSVIFLWPAEYILWRMLNVL